MSSDSEADNLDQIEDSMEFPMEDGYTDIALVVEDKRIYLNKGFLMSTSPVFKMFLGEFKEKTSTEIPLPDKKYKEMVPFFKCLLQNEEYKLSDEHVIPVMYLAWEYQTIQLVRRCEEYFMLAYYQRSETSFSTEFLLKIYKTGELVGRATLVATTLNHLAKRSYGDIKSKEIYKMFPLDLRVKLLEQRVNALEANCRKNHSNCNDCHQLFQNNTMRMSFLT